MKLENVNRCQVRPGDLIAHRGFAVLVADRHGEIGGGFEGFYLHRTRFLSRLSLTVDGKKPTFVSANQVEHHSLIAYHLAPSPAGAAAGPTPEDASKDGGEMAAKGIEIHIGTFVGDGMHLDVHVTNHAMAETTVTLGIELAADFAGMTEADTGKRQQTAAVDQHWTMHGGTDVALGFSYRHAKLNHATTIRVSGGDHLDGDGGTVSCQLKLSPRAPRSIGIDVVPVFLGKTVEPYYGRDGAVAGDDASAVTRAAWEAGCAELSSDGNIVQAAWNRAVSDLASLQIVEGPPSEHAMVIAGIPKYTGLFGRDALLTAWQSSRLTAATMQGALEVVARWNATEYDDHFDAQPGKVLHQRELGPLSLLGKTAFQHYYGDYSTPGLLLLGAATHLAQTGDVAFFKSMREKLIGTLEWMDRDGDIDGDGFYEYRTLAGKFGLKNQSWKDSGDAILYPDGRMVDDPIAMCDIQGLYYAAKQALGLAFATTGERDLADRLLAEAAALKQRFNERFWMPDENYFAMALDPDKRQVRSIGSDVGACLAFGIVDADHAAAVAERLLAPDMFSGWGIRTLSSEHPAFNPFCYHLGTIWPSPNAVICYGLRRYGFDAAMHTVASGLFDASRIFDLDRLPEVFGGHPRDQRHPHPGLYAGACSPQAWSAGAVILLVDTLLGLTPLAPRNTLIVDPCLPEWLPEMTLRNIQVGQERVDLRFRRDASGHTEHQMLGNRSVRIHRPEPGGAGDRLARAISAVVAQA